jgi:hypothetical protein
MRPDTLSESADQFHPVNGLNPVPLEKFRGDGQLFCAAEASKRAIFWGEHIFHCTRVAQSHEESERWTLGASRLRSLGAQTARTSGRLRVALYGFSPIAAALR